MVQLRDSVKYRKGKVGNSNVISNQSKNIFSVFMMVYLLNKGSATLCVLQAEKPSKSEPNI